MGLLPFFKKDQNQNQNKPNAQFQQIPQNFPQDNMFGNFDFSSFNQNQPLGQLPMQNNYNINSQQPFSSFDQPQFQQSPQYIPNYNYNIPPQQPPLNNIPPIPNQQPENQMQDLKSTIDVEIDQKIEPINSILNDLLNWKDKVEQEINNIQQNIIDLSYKINNLYDILAKKVEEYDKGLKENTIELQAFHRLIRTLLPSITESTRELKETIEELKSLKDDLKK